MSADGAYSDSYASNAFSMFDGANNNTHLTYDLVQVRVLHSLLLSVSYETIVTGEGGAGAIA